MNDPKRWADDPSLPAEMRDWLSHAPRPRDPSAANVARMASRAAKIASGTPFTSAFVSKLIGVVMGVVAGSAGLFAASRAGVFEPPLRHASSMVASARASEVRAPVAPHVFTGATSPPVHLPIEAPVGVAPFTTVAPPTIPTPPRAHAPLPIPIRARHDVAISTPAPTTTGSLDTAGSVSNSGPRPEDPLVVQTAQLTLAEDALRRGDPTDALSILDALATAYPDGGTAAEREYYAVLALQRMGREDASRVRAERLVARFPSSPAAARVRRMLQTPSAHENVPAQ